MDSLLTESIPMQKPKKNLALLKSSFIVFILMSVIGCTHFSNDDEDEVQDPDPVVTIAPTAEFTSSIVSGTEPLEVDFTDTSTAGTSVITTWAWDFGDGNTSTVQNPQYTYSTAGSYSVSLTVTTADGSDAITKTDLITVNPALVSVKVAVVDTDGVLLQDVVIESIDFEILQQQTDDSGTELSVTPNTTDGVFNVSKAGYLTNYLFMEGVGVNQSLNIVLKEKAEPIVFNAFFGGNFFGPDGTSVGIPPEALRRADGSIVTGEVELYITPIDISDEREVGAFPGSYYGTDGIGEPQDSLFSYGVFDITFEENGVELQLIDDTLATLILPLYATKSYENADLVVGDVIPLWYLDVETGLWMYESDGQVIADPIAPNGLALEATTSHFTTFNSDINPPGLGRGAPSSGGSNNYVCNMSIDLIGANIDEKYLYTIAYSRAGWPASKNSRFFTFEGNPLGQNILRGFYVTTTVSNGEVEGSTSFFCDGSNINRTITLGEQAPVIIDFNLRVEPVFDRDSNGQSEVISNNIYVGGYWVGAQLGTIESDLLATPYILSRGIYQETEYNSSDPSQAFCSLTVANDFGQEDITSSVNYIAEQPPVLGIAYAYFEQEANLTIVSWVNVEGLDSVEVYYMEDISDHILRRVGMSCPKLVRQVN
ncbi:PKD domain-containing protein [Aliiglaciecola sp.]|nr:PKD domain-containing protein [Aliiglaciecola sp.]